MVRRLISAILGIAVLISLSGSALGADAKHGKRLFFQRCTACHSIVKDAPSTIGPNLFGVVGRPAGTLPGFTYSAAMKNSKLTWTETVLATYLANPEKTVTGTHMSFQGFTNATDASDVAAFLATQK